MKILKTTIISSLPIFILFATLLFLFPHIVFAYDCMCPNGTTVAKVVAISSECGDVSSLAACSSGGSGSGGTVSLENPLTGTSDNPNINLIIGKAINGVLGVVGSLALLMVIYGGFTWMLAAGNQTRVQKGKDILIWAVVGLVVIFSAYALVRFLFVNIFGATPATTSLLQFFRLV